MTCSSCKNLNEKKKIDGLVSGARYYCKINKTYVSGDQSICNKYLNSLRNTEKCNKIYQDGIDFYNDVHSVFFYVVLCIIAIIIFLIARFSNPELFLF